MAYNNGPKIVTDGLVLCLDAANRKSYPGSGTSWLDLSGNGNNFTNFGSTFNDGYKGYFNFDSNDYSTLNIANISQLKIENILGNSNTLSAWINLTTQNATNLDATETLQGIIIWPGYHNGIAISSTTIIFYCWNSTRNTLYSHSYATTLPLNTWINITHTLNYQSQNASWFINGTFTQQQNTVPASVMPSSVGNPANSLNIGAARATATYRWYLNNGKISNIQIYNRALSPNEVQQNYNALKGRYGLT